MKKMSESHLIPACLSDYKKPSTVMVDEEGKIVPQSDDEEEEDERPTSE